MKDATPDYSRYTLDDLYDVARRVNKERYPDRYALIVQELEKREPPPPVVAGPPLTATEPRAAPRPAVPPVQLAGGCFLPIIRFVGGFMVTAYTVTFLILPTTSEWTPLWALIGGFYFAVFLQEKTYAPGDPVTLGCLFQKTLLLLVYGWGGGVLASWDALLLAIFLMPSDSPDLIPGVSNFDTTNYMLNGSVVLGAGGTVWLWRRGKQSYEKQYSRL